MKEIIVGCNILTHLDSLVYGNHCQLWYRLGRNFTDYNFIFSAPRRTSIDNMRNLTISMGVYRNCEYVFFYDDDVVVPTDALSKLIKLMESDSNIAVASGLTYVRKYPYVPMLFRVSEDQSLHNYKDFKEHVDENGILTKDLGAVGFSCVLLRTAFLRNLRPPYCVTGSSNTEDVYLCRRIIDHYPEAKIACDTTIDTGHLVERYFVTDENIDDLRKYEEVVNKAKLDNLGDRGSEYANGVESRLRSQ